jgi:hypothetical protein
MGAIVVFLFLLILAILAPTLIVALGLIVLLSILFVMGTKMMGKEKCKCEHFNGSCSKKQVGRICECCDENCNDVLVFNVKDIDNPNFTQDPVNITHIPIYNREPMEDKAPDYKPPMLDSAEPTHGPFPSHERENSPPFADYYTDPTLGYKWMSDVLYTRCYPTQSYETNNCDLYAHQGGDEAIARYRIAKSRERKTIDGWASKNANFYKKHFGNELQESEQKRWWGNDEW